MKNNMIARIFATAILVTGLSVFASAQKPQFANALNFASVATAGASIGKAAANTAALYTVSANASRTHTYSMSRGERVRIVLDGDGDTDLDLYVYDSAGILVDCATGYSDYEELYITSYANTTMTVKVVNRGGVYNQYDLSVWTL
jgi:hypothetical protein